MREMTMKTGGKHFRFINSITGNVIYYYSAGDLCKEELHEELERVKAHVAIQNGVFVDTIYWEEIKDESTPHVV